MLATGGYGNVFYLSTNAKGCNVTAAWRAYRRGAGFANPCFTQIHPTCIPSSGDYQSKLTLMSESLRNDGRIWVPEGRATAARRGEIPEDERDYYLERIYPSFGNLVPRDIASRRAKQMVRRGPRRRASRPTASTSTSRTPSSGWASDVIEERYGNLFDMYERITGENPYEVPMRIYPAPHYTMGGLWVDYNLMSNVPGLFVIGEANFSDHGANRLGASALMQGLADGYFVLPYTIGDYLARQPARGRSTPTTPAFARGRDGGAASASSACSTSAASAPSTRSTASSASWSGRTAAWRATRRACSEAHRSRSPSCARSSGRTSRSRAAARTSTRRSRRPAGWPTSSSWPS